MSAASKPLLSAQEPEQQLALHALTTKVESELEAMRYNNAISAMMSFTNAANKWTSFPLQARRVFVQLLAPFAPHLAEELWQRQLGGEGSVAHAAWPVVAAPAALEEEVATVAVQLNGKTRGVLKLPAAAAQEEAAVLEALHADERLGEHQTQHPGDLIYGSMAG